MNHQSWLQAELERRGAVAGSVHVRDGDRLRLVASVNLPPAVLKATAEIARGKGMAGLAWERGRSVSTCNLQTDESGDVRPGAKAVGAAAALAMPVHAADGELRAVVGLAFASPREFQPAELEAYEASAAELPDDD